VLKIFKRKIQTEYHEKLIKAFPKKIHSDLKEVLKILPLDNRQIKLCDGKNHQVDNLIHDNKFNVQHNKETLIIPYRLYFDEPNPELEKKLTETQRTILNCIYLRHHNGYLREKRLKLLSNNLNSFTIPHIIQLLGEYIYELLPIIDQKINENTIEFFSKFTIENPRYWQKTESRMISYWNEYYRYKFPKLKDYVGFKIIKRIKNDAQQRI